MTPTVSIPDALRRSAAASPAKTAAADLLLRAWPAIAEPYVWILQDPADKTAFAEPNWPRIHLDLQQNAIERRLSSGETVLVLIAYAIATGGLKDMALLDDECRNAVLNAVATAASVQR